MSTILDTVQRYGNGIEGNNPAYRTLKSGLTAVAVDKGCGSIERVSVAAKAGFLHASSVKSGDELFIVETYLAPPLLFPWIFVEIFNLLQFRRHSLVDGVSRVIRGKFQDEIGKVLFHLGKNGTGHKGTGHGFRDKGIGINILEHDRPDLFVDVLSNGKVELQGKVRFLLDELIREAVRDIIGAIQKEA